MEFYKLIRIERRKYDITQVELSAAIGGSGANSYISTIERGVVPISDAQFQKIMDAITKIAVSKGLLVVTEKSTTES